MESSIQKHFYRIEKNDILYIRQSTPLLFSFCVDNRCNVVWYELNIGSVNWLNPINYLTVFLCFFFHRATLLQFFFQTVPVVTTTVQHIVVLNFLTFKAGRGVLSGIGISINFHMTTSFNSNLTFLNVDWTPTYRLWGRNITTSLSILEKFWLEFIKTNETYNKNNEW